jgi:soluble lytic murein transglycosylase
VLLAAAPLAPAAAVTENAERAAQRAEYRAALADLYAVRLRDFDIRLERLSDYPLRPYLEYQRLLRYVSSATPEDVAAFRERWAETPLADRVLNEWLDNLARRGEWATYRAAYDPEVARGTAAECRFFRSLLETGETERAFAGARDLWLVDHSQPKVCDPLFDAWIDAGRLDDALAWQRLHMALEAGRSGLARYLVRFLDASSQRLAENHVALHRAPHRLRRMTAIPGADDGAREVQVVAHAIRRLARRDAEAAEAEWTRWQARLAFPPHERSRVREALVRHSARQGRLPAGFATSWPPPELADAAATELVEELARGAVRSQDWDALASWIEHLPDWARRESGWQYWAARVDLQRSSGPRRPAVGETFEIEAPEGPRLPDSDADPPAMPPRPEARPVPLRARAESRLADLARQRNFYGFLAADRTDRPFDLQRAGFDLGEVEIDAVGRHPAMRRAQELRAIGELPEARREMAWLMNRLSDRELLALAEYARRIGWHRQSIQAAIAAEHWDQVDLRFPLAYEGPMIENARDREIDPSWLYAVARQESAFMADARSSAGALGIMQLLPSTARLTARRNDVPLGSTWDLLDERKNIQLGSLYLRQMYDRYDHNRVLASAAYNAGPGRVDRWVSERAPNPADVWIEGIPFRETRGYVQNVLAYALIYSQQLGLEQPFLYEHER